MTEEQYTKSRLAHLGLAILLVVIFVLLLLTLPNAFATSDNNDVKEVCKEVDGKMKNGFCDTGGGDTKKADRFEEKMTEREQREQEADKSYNYEGENEASESQEEKEFEHREYIADLEDDLADVDNEEDKGRTQDELDAAKEQFDD